ncbi:MAG: LEA type 2 family protein [Acidilobaceae archaeon]
MRNVGVAVVLVVIVLAAWTAYSYRAVSNVAVEDLRIVGASVIYSPGLVPVPRSLEILLELQVENPSPYGLRASDLEYELRVEGRSIGNGSAQGFLIEPGENIVRIPFLLDLTRSSNVIATIIAVVSKGYAEVEVRGKFTARAEIFGVTVPLQAPVTFEKKERVAISFR